MHVFSVKNWKRLKKMGQDSLLDNVLRDYWVNKNCYLYLDIGQEVGL